MLRKDLPIRSNLTDVISTVGVGTLTIYANPIVSKVRTDLLSDAGGITIPEPLIEVLWNPSYIDTALWLDASVSASVVLDGSGNVSQWLDLSGNDRHFTQTVPGFRPDYLTGDALVFDGVDDRLTCAYTFCNTAPCSVFVVSESSGSVRYGLMGTRHSDTSRGFIFNYRSSFENTTYASIGGARVVASGSIRDLDINSFERVNSTQSQVKSFLNTSSVLTYTGVLVAANQGTILGAEDFVIFGFLNGKIKKVLIIEDAVDAATREKIEGWMAHDCGITANLPIGHPYKNSPPTVF